MLKAAIFLIFLLINQSVAPRSPDAIDLNKFDFDPNSPQFWNSMRVMPVKFLDKTDNYLSAVFASDYVLKNITFVLPPKLEKEQGHQAVFFQQGKGWEEQIDRKTFLKKFKRDYWLTTYVTTEGENIIIDAHQFKNWQALKTSYASHPDHPRRSVNSPEFWEDIRKTLGVFYDVKGDKAYWIFLNPIEKNEPFIESDYQYISLLNGYLLEKRITKVNRTFDFRILEQGVLTLQKNTVFDKSELEIDKPRRVLNVIIFDGKLRLRPISVDKEYFVANAAKEFWICFYDSKYQSIVRLAQAADEDPNKK